MKATLKWIYKALKNEVIDEKEIRRRGLSDPPLEPQIEVFEYLNHGLRFRAVTIGYPCDFASDGATEEEALKNLEKEMILGYQKLGKLISPILERKEKERMDAISEKWSGALKALSDRETICDWNGCPSCGGHGTIERTMKEYSELERTGEINYVNPFEKTCTKCNGHGVLYDDGETDEI
jgi:hypothetical protein